MVVAVVIGFVAAPTAGHTARLTLPKRVYAVGMRTETFVDKSRETPAYPSIGVAAAPARTIETTIWYPAGGAARNAVTPNAKPSRKGAPFPLILFSHGNGSDAGYYAGLLRQWAAAGFVVAGPTFPVTTHDIRSNDGVADVKNQPGDVSYVLDQLLRMNRRHTWLRGLLDPRRIGAAGHSLGGATTYGVVYTECCRDKRITAAIVLAGVPLLGDAAVDRFTTPLLLVHGDHDGSAPYAITPGIFQKARGLHWFLTVLGGTHTSYFPGVSGENARQADVVVRVTTDFWRAELRGQDAARQAIATDGNVANVAKLESQ